MLWVLRLSECSGAQSKVTRLRVGSGLRRRWYRWQITRKFRQFVPFGGRPNFIRGVAESKDNRRDLKGHYRHRQLPHKTVHLRPCRLQQSPTSPVQCGRGSLRFVGGGIAARITTRCSTRRPKCRSEMPRPDPQVSISHCSDSLAEKRPSRGVCGSPGREAFPPGLRPFFCNRFHKTNSPPGSLRAGLLDYAISGTRQIS